MNSAHTDKCAVPVVSAKEVERLVKLNDVGNEKNKVAYLNTKKKHKLQVSGSITLA